MGWFKAILLATIIFCILIALPIFVAVLIFFGIIICIKEYQDYAAEEAELKAKESSKEEQ